MDAHTRHIHTMHAHAVHAHVAHTHAVHAHIIHGPVMHVHAMHANALHCMLCQELTANMPSVAIGSKPVYQRHANSTSFKFNTTAKVGMSLKMNSALLTTAKV